MVAEIISRKGTLTPSLTKTPCAPTGSISGQSNVSVVRTELLLQCPSLHLLILLEALFPSTLPKVGHCTDHTRKSTCDFHQPFFELENQAVLSLPLTWIRRKTTKWVASNQYWSTASTVYINGVTGGIL